jgi:hypothetical protein
MREAGSLAGSTCKRLLRRFGSPAVGSCQNPQFKVLAA